MTTPSVYLPPQLDNIPAEMRQLPRWVCWLPVWKINSAGIGKWTKVPKMPNGIPASSTDPATWSTLEAVTRAYATGRFGGIGWVFQPPYAGVDFDHCVDRDLVLPDVLQWVVQFASYTELSVSGTGLHILVHAAVPPFGRKVGPREAYNHGRFFTFSGHRWPGTPATIDDRPAVLHRFVDEVLGGYDTKPPVTPITPFVPTGRYAILGPRTLTHLHSTGPGRYPSASEADAAAAAALIATGHTAEEALALLLASPRGQDALQRKGKGGEAYLSRTVANASAHVGPVVAHSSGLRSHRLTIRRPATCQAAARRPL